MDPQLFSVRDTRGLADQGLGWSTPSTRAWNGANKTSILQFLLVPQRPTPELVDGLGDPRRVAEDRHKDTPTISQKCCLCLFASMLEAAS